MANTASGFTPSVTGVVELRLLETGVLPLSYLLDMAYAPHIPGKPHKKSSETAAWWRDYVYGPVFFDNLTALIEGLLSFEPTVRNVFTKTQAPNIVANLSSLLQSQPYNCPPSTSERQLEIITPEPGNWVLDFEFTPESMLRALPETYHGDLASLELRRYYDTEMRRYMWTIWRRLQCTDASYLRPPSYLEQAALILLAATSLKLSYVPEQSGIRFILNNEAVVKKERQIVTTLGFNLYGALSASSGCPTNIK